MERPKPDPQMTMLEPSGERARPRRSGYVVLVGLLTGFPPFITTGSLVLLLRRSAAFGTVSPTSCKDGSLYMATEERGQGKWVRVRFRIRVWVRLTWGTEYTDVTSDLKNDLF